MVPSKSRQSSEAVERWLETPVGQSLQQLESRMVERALDGVFGEVCLQLGLWGGARAFLKFARTQRTAAIGSPDRAGDHGPPAAFADLHRLPVASDSVDAVILPHSLELSDRPQAILREVQRVLRSDGHVIVLGFKPGGLWGLRRLLPGGGFPPGVENFLSDRRLADWLELLDMRIQQSVRYYFHWPLSVRRAGGSARWERRGRRWWPELAACYLLKAQKRLLTLTPVRKPWRARAKVVGGLIEPTSRVTHIHCDPK